MGGDHGIPVTVRAALAFLRRQPDASLLLVGREPEVKAALPARASSSIEVIHADEVVEMHDPVAVALRTKRNSSMRVAINLLKEGRADVCVSAGNTGALMAIARFVLKTLDGIDRPAIATVLPNRRDGFTTVLDLGANVDCTAEHLLQFAVMGSALVAAVERLVAHPGNAGQPGQRGQQVDRPGNRADRRTRPHVARPARERAMCEVVREEGVAAVEVRLDAGNRLPGLGGGKVECGDRVGHGAFRLPRANGWQAGS